MRSCIGVRFGQGGCGSVEDHGSRRLVAPCSVYCDGRYSCGDDVGMAVHQLVYSCIRGGRDCGRVATASVLSAPLTCRQAGWMTAKSGDSRWQRDLHPVFVGSST